MSIVKSYHSLCFLIQVNVYTSFKTKLPRSLYSASHKVQQARESVCGGWGGDGMGGGGAGGGADRQTDRECSAYYCSEAFGKTIQKKL